MTDCHGAPWVGAEEEEKLQHLTEYRFTWRGVILWIKCLVVLAQPITREEALSCPHTNWADKRLVGRASSYRECCLL